ncbi:MAG: DNA alkylation repair protein, partial [Paracoccaceae bacterium]
EARVAAAKLLTQARIRPDTAAWDLIAAWVPQFDAWALADHASIAGQKRLVADPSRLDHVESWISHDTMWVRRAALVMTLPWTKQNHPTPQDSAIRARVLGWCVALAPDRDWFIQKAIAWWLRDLSKHDAPLAAAFLADHGESLKSFARKEAAKYLA